MKPADVKSSTYIDSSKEINEKGRKFKIDDISRISKHENIFFAKDCTPNWNEKIFVIKEVKYTVPWILLMILVEKKLSEHSAKKNCRK